MKSAALKLNTALLPFQAIAPKIGEFTLYSTSLQSMEDITPQIPILTVFYFYLVVK